MSVGDGQAERRGIDAIWTHNENKKKPHKAIKHLTERAPRTDSYSGVWIIDERGQTERKERCRGAATQRDKRCELGDFKHEQVAVNAFANTAHKSITQKTPLSGDQHV